MTAAVGGVYSSAGGACGGAEVGRGGGPDVGTGGGGLWGSGGGALEGKAGAEYCGEGGTLSTRRGYMPWVTSSTETAAAIGATSLVGLGGLVSLAGGVGDWGWVSFGAGIWGAVTVLAETPTEALDVACLAFGEFAPPAAAVLVPVLLPAALPAKQLSHTFCCVVLCMCGRIIFFCRWSEQTRFPHLRQWCLR